MRIILILICFVFSFFQTFELKSQIRYGLSVGIGCSYIRSGIPEWHARFGYSDPLLSYNIGGFASKDLSEKFNANLEIQLGRKGFAYYIANYFELKSITAKHSVYTTNLNAFGVYQLLKRENKRRSSTFGIIGGIYTSFLFNNKWTYGNEEPVNVDNSLRSFDFGFMTGLRFKREVFKKKKCWSVDIKYTQGVIDISETWERTTFNNFEVGFSYVLWGKKRKK